MENIICDTLEKCTRYHKAKSASDVWWSDSLFKEKQKVKKEIKKAEEAPKQKDEGYGDGRQTKKLRKRNYVVTVICDWRSCFMIEK